MVGALGSRSMEPGGRADRVRRAGGVELVLHAVRFLFVLPGAIVGAYMQTVRARPLLGALLFVAIVVVIPAFLWPAGLTGDFSELSRRL